MVHESPGELPVRMLSSGHIHGNVRVYEDLQTVEAAQMVADGQHVQEALSRVLVPPVTRVDDIGRYPLGQEACGSRRPVTYDDHVDPHGL